MPTALNALGLPPGATEAEIKERWRRLAMANHPDRGGDTAMFQELKRHYENALKRVIHPSQDFLDSDEELTSKSIFKEACGFCAGRGYKSMVNGFGVLQFPCLVCSGTGKE